MLSRNAIINASCAVFRWGHFPAGAAAGKIAKQPMRKMIVARVKTAIGMSMSISINDLAYMPDNAIAPLIKVAMAENMVRRIHGGGC